MQTVFFSVVDSSSWPDVDSQPQSLEDSWRLRVTAAQVYSIMKSRDMQNFEKVLGFLETTHKLLPRLVPAIKHMKIMFGLKTMVRRTQLTNSTVFICSLKPFLGDFSFFLAGHHVDVEGTQRNG